MPQLFVQTNLTRQCIPDSFVQKAVAVVAQTLNRPKQLTVVLVQPDSLMSWGGTSEPCALITLKAIGNLGIEENKITSKAISELVSKELAIPDNRMFIVFEENSAADVGFRGTTFLELLSKHDLLFLTE